MQVQRLTPFLLLLLILSCSKPRPKETLNPRDRVDSRRVEPIHFLHKTFSVKKNVLFEFVVPPHTAIPRLHGTFQSFVRRPGEDELSDESADVELILMNPDQYQGFLATNGRGTALYTVDPTHDHEVEFHLSPTGAEPQKYYIVFRNSPGGAALKYVRADFTVGFGYE